MDKAHKLNAQIGDWICWMQDGQFMHGEIRYIRDGGPARSYNRDCITTNGIVCEDSVLELRRKS